MAELDTLQGQGRRELKEQARFVELYQQYGQTELMLSTLIRDSGPQVGKLLDEFKNKDKDRKIMEVKVPIGMPSSKYQLAIIKGNILPSSTKFWADRTHIYDDFSVGILTLKKGYVVVEYCYKTSSSQREWSDSPLETQISESFENVPRAMRDFTERNNVETWGLMGRRINKPYYLIEALGKYKIPPITQQINLKNIENFCKENFKNPRYFDRLPEL